MKLLTCNTHSLVEKDYEKKLWQFAEAIAQQQPDVIALQEVNQSCSSKCVVDGLDYYVACAGNETYIRQDNHLWRAAQLLFQKGVPYYWTWIPIKKGYDKYDEGLGFLIKESPREVMQAYISQIQDYENWKTRKVLGVKDRQGRWYYCVHMGWWQDEEEPFLYQWQQLKAVTGSRSMAAAKDRSLAAGSSEVFLMGDFNSPAHITGEGYSTITGDGWLDTYMLAKEKDAGTTVPGVIDGWRDKETAPDMRMDYIFTNKPVSVKSSKVIFDGEWYPVISDHFGVMTELV